MVVHCTALRFLIIIITIIVVTIIILVEMVSLHTAIRIVQMLAELIWSDQLSTKIPLSLVANTSLHLWKSSSCTSDFHETLFNRQYIAVLALFWKLLYSWLAIFANTQVHFTFGTLKLFIIRFRFTRTRCYKNFAHLFVVINV